MTGKQTKHNDVSSSNEMSQLLDYYAQTAQEYDIHEHDEEHRIALNLAVPLMTHLRVRSVLDVGCGTGRVIRYLSQRLPGVCFHGMDPSRELLDVAIERHGIPQEWLSCGTGEDIPFDDGSFDVAVATGVLHHVAQADVVIEEMLRISRIGIFLSDTNTYGQGRLAMRLIKIGARQLNIIRPLQWIRHGGKQWIYSEGDGVSRPYSLFDSLQVLNQSCSTVVIIPTKGSKGMQAFPLLSASHVLACGMKEAL